MYDISDHETYNHIGRWLQELREYGEPNMVIMLVGNKCDLSYRRMVPTEEAKMYAGILPQNALRRDCNGKCIE